MLLSQVAADNQCKQYGHRSGPTKCRAWYVSKLSDALMVFLKLVFEIVDFEKNLQMTKKLQKFPSIQSINTDYNVIRDTTTRSDCNNHAFKSLFSEDDSCFFQGSVISASSNKGNIKTNKLLSAESIQVIISLPTSAVCWYFLQTALDPDQALQNVQMIWIQTAWHSDSVPERIGKKLILKKILQTTKKACKIN